MSRDILLSTIDTDPTQPRRHFDPAQLEELAASIRENGLIQPILLRPVGDRFMLVQGERRLRAVQSLGWVGIPAEVRDLDPDEARWLTLVENIQRADLSPVEEAHAYAAMLDQGITQTDLGRRIGKSQSHIATKIRYLALPDEIQTALATRQITEGHAKQLLRLVERPALAEVFAAVLAERLSVHATAEWIDQVIEGRTTLRRLETEIDHHFHTVVEQLRATGQALKAIRAELSPAQFDAWQRQQPTPELLPDEIDAFIWIAEHQEIASFVELPESIQSCCIAVVERAAPTLAQRA